MDEPTPPAESVALPDAAATARFAASLAPRLRPGDTVLLSGALGAGKTTLVRALLRTLTDTPALEVPSPSYTLIQTYDTPRGPVHHFDLWRLHGSAALAELGWDDARAGITLVEWPDRLGSLTPPDALRIRLDITDDDRRTIHCAGWPAARWQ